MLQPLRTCTLRLVTVCGTLARKLACAQVREPDVEGGNSNPSVCVSECLQAGVYLVHICKFKA